MKGRYHKKERTETKKGSVQNTLADELQDYIIIFNY